MEHVGFGKRLQHEVPSWVAFGALFHIRIRSAANNPIALTDSVLGAKLLDSVRFYSEKHRWHVRIFLLMPDHLHALLAFPGQEAMAAVIGQWKAYHAKNSKIVWQENFFDHRIRNDEQVDAKMRYIRMNPVVKGLCDTMEDWPWWIGPSPAR
jgi:putative transposase